MLTGGMITDFFDYPVKPEEIRMLSTESVSPKTFFALPESELNNQKKSCLANHSTAPHFALDSLKSQNNSNNLVTKMTN